MEAGQNIRVRVSQKLTKYDQNIKANKMAVKNGPFWKVGKKI